MSNWKRILIGCFATALCFAFPSCKNGTDTDERMTVVATNFALYDFARAVCGDSCDVRMLLSPGSESHDFEATLEDVALLSRTDVFVYVGGESEEWVPDLLEGAPDVVQVRALDLVETYMIEEENEVDEHVWTSIPNAVAILDAIRIAVASVEDSLLDTVTDNSAVYAAELYKIDEEIRGIVATAGRKQLVFADRFPFRYFTEEYGLDYAAAFSGCSSAVEPSLATVNSLIDLVTQNNLPAVLTIEFSDRTTADAIARETGCEVLEFHSAHNVSRADFDSGVTYADLMRRNANVLRTVLN